MFWVAENPKIFQMCEVSHISRPDTCGCLWHRCSLLSSPAVCVYLVAWQLHSQTLLREKKREGKMCVYNMERERERERGNVSSLSWGNWPKSLGLPRQWQHYAKVELQLPNMELSSGDGGELKTGCCHMSNGQSGVREPTAMFNYELHLVQETVPVVAQGHQLWPKLSSFYFYLQARLHTGAHFRTQLY